MSNSSKTIWYFSFYLFVIGAVLVLAPNLMLKVFGMTPTDEVWIKVVGMLVLLIGVLYYQAAQQKLHGIYRFMAYNRVLVLLFFIAFVLLGWAEWQLMLFGGVDAAGALWTWMALRKEGR